MRQDMKRKEVSNGASTKVGARGADGEEDEKNGDYPDRMRTKEGIHGRIRNNRDKVSQESKKNAYFGVAIPGDQDSIRQYPYDREKEVREWG